MPMPKLDKVREQAPVLLSIVRDSGWCFSYGLVSVVVTVPVLIFESYELWKCRKEGWHKIMHRVISFTGVVGTSCLMLSDLYFGNHLRPYAKWIFGCSPVLLGLYALFLWRTTQTNKRQTQRVMAISKETNSIVFVHTQLDHLHKPTRNYHAVTVRHRHNRR